MPNPVGRTHRLTTTNGMQAAQGSPSRSRGAVSTPLLVAIIVVVALVAGAAWWFLGHRGEAPATSTTATTPAQGPSDAGTTPAVSATQPDLSVDELYGQARAAMSANRMVAPAGNNALEYYLRILAKQPDDTDATDAVRELFPFATGSAEDQINQSNFDEATRIMDLLAKADPSNYTLTILRSKLEAKKRQNERELAQQAQREAAATAAAAAPAQPAAAETQEAAAAVAEEAPAPAPPPPPEPVGETRDVRVVTPPAPSYPPVAVRNRQNGWVEVEFTVSASGAVENAHVTASNPSRVFDREAVRAIENARFEARLDKGQPVATTIRRRIEFKLAE
jgi:protein TonB